MKHSLSHPAQAGQRVRDPNRYFFVFESCMAQNIEILMCTGRRRLSAEIMARNDTTIDVNPLFMACDDYH
jgi:hypothetical protein